MANIPWTVESGVVRLDVSGNPCAVRPHPIQSPFSDRTVWDVYRGRINQWCVPHTTGTISTIPASEYGAYMRAIDKEASKFLKGLKSFFLLPDEPTTLQSPLPPHVLKDRCRPIHWANQKWGWHSTIPFATHHSILNPSIDDWVAQWETQSYTPQWKMEIIRAHELRARGLHPHNMEPVNA